MYGRNVEEVKELLSRKNSSISKIQYDNRKELGYIDDTLPKRLPNNFGKDFGKDNAEQSIHMSLRMSQRKCHRACH